VTDSVQYHTENSHIEAAEIIDKLSVLAVHPPEEDRVSFVRHGRRRFLAGVLSARVRTCFYVDDNKSCQHVRCWSRREQPGRLLAATPSVCSSAGAVDLWIYATTKPTKRPSTSDALTSEGEPCVMLKGKGGKAPCSHVYGAFEVFGPAFTPTPDTYDV